MMNDLEQLTRQITGDDITLDEIEKAISDAAASREAADGKRARYDGAHPGSDTEEEGSQEPSDLGAAGEATRAAKAAT